MENIEKAKYWSSLEVLISPFIPTSSINIVPKYIKTGKPVKKT
jgi:hypothetical protein